MTKGIVTVDIGTTSIRAVLFDEDGRSRYVSQRDNPPHYFPDGRVEQSPNTWKKFLFELLADCANAAEAFRLDLSAVSVTAQRSSVIPVDAAGEPLHDAIMWQDQRTDRMCRDMQEHTAAVFQKTGLRISSVFSAPKMRWFREERPEIYRRAHKLAGIQDYVLYLLTGTFRTDHSLASRTGLFNLETRDWDDDLIKLYGLDRHLLCDLIEPGSIVGTLQRAVANVSQLPAGIPVISAGGDQSCAALGMGLLEPGDLVVNTGTGGYVLRYSAQPVLDRHMRLFCGAAAVPDAYVLEAGLLASGTIYRWFADQFYPARMDARSDRFADVNADAAASPPGANGVLLLPHFKGAGAPHWNPNARGLFYNLTLGTTRRDMARAILEGLAAETAENIAVMEQLSGETGVIRSAGGLAKNRLYNQIQADLFGKTVIRPPESEATALGAWMSAARTVGLFATFADAYRLATEGQAPETYIPDAQNHAIYRSLADRSNRIYRALSDSGIYDQAP